MSIFEPTPVLNLSCVIVSLLLFYTTHSWCIPKSWLCSIFSFKFKIYFQYMTIECWGYSYSNILYINLSGSCSEFPWLTPRLVWEKNWIRFFYKKLKICALSFIHLWVCNVMIQNDIIVLCLFQFAYIHIYITWTSTFPFDQEAVLASSHPFGQSEHS